MNRVEVERRRMSESPAGSLLLRNQGPETMQPQFLYRFVSSLLLTGIVSLVSGWGLGGAAIATGPVRTPTVAQHRLDGVLLVKADPAVRPTVANLAHGIRVSTNPTAQLPTSMVSALRSDLSQKTGIAAKKLRVVDAKQKTWPNGCLGLAKADEMCTQMMVNGWQVVLSNGVRRWVYRTDAKGTVYRLETPIRQPIKPQANQSRPHQSSASLPADTSALHPTQIPVNELPTKLPDNVVFQAIASGGFIGRTYQTTLLKDGRMLRVMLNPDGSSTQPEVHQIPASQVLQFQQLATSRLARFHQLNYPAVPGSADFFTVTLSTPSSTVRYADTIQAQLPKDLQTVVQAWNHLNQR